MWNEHTEEGKVCWIHEKYGNVFKTPDGKYITAVPRVIKLGPFEDLDDAKNAAEDKNGNLNRVLENYNLELANLTRQIKGQ